MNPNPDTPTDIAVAVTTDYVPGQSIPEARRYVYAYTITISNQGPRGAQLLSRHWIIKDEAERTQEVMGEGVVGEQPYIAPGEHYTYTSGVVLETETGLMQGSYQMRDDDGRVFDAAIPAFALVPPHAVH
ncbi:Co2+/Mg2+ efflux protein ApaG [Marinimicrobium alkaliphilum]|uniref:Co2+/Mg2+ efflux protein ApaG n=1 Tax=Marinimicrobium alkaliphilum TaxID=2202654 RepID=UPI000DBAAB5B|nr:Co2+/Mg2+ efflux protein ApaG [Marinimicrobium alkaliphilum]